MQHCATDWNNLSRDKYTFNFKENVAVFALATMVSITNKPKLEILNVCHSSVSLLDN
jgi:hypothetical protein